LFNLQAYVAVFGSDNADFAMRFASRCHADLIM